VPASFAAPLTGVHFANLASLKSRQPVCVSSAALDIRIPTLNFAIRVERI
jgi:hypothetical protein